MPKSSIGAAILAVASLLALNACTNNESGIGSSGQGGGTKSTSQSSVYSMDGTGQVLTSAGPSSAASGDQQVLDQLKAAGSNLTRLHDIDFYLIFPAETQANKASQEMQRDGFSTQVIYLSPEDLNQAAEQLRSQGISSQQASKGEWECIGRKTMIPELGPLVQLRSQFISLAKSLGGTYDGWDTAVVR